MVKPVRLEQLRGIWTHVLKNDVTARKLPSEDGDKVEKVGANHMKKYSRKNKKVVDVADEDESRSTQKKQRVQWYGQLHQKFVQAVEQIGIDKAVPRTILEVMKVEGLTRANVASHLQKYRIYLRKLSEGTLRKSPFAEETEALRRNMTLPSFIGSPSSSNHCAKMNSSSAIGMQVSLPTESVQVVSSQRNLGVPQSNLEPVGHRPPLTSNMSFSSSRSCNSYASSSGQVPTFRNEYQNKIAGIIGNTTREQVATFSYGNNTHSTATTIGNSALAGSSSTRPDLQIDNNASMPAQVLNGGGASDNLHVGSIVNQQAVSDQVHNINEFLMGTSESQNGERDTFNDLFAYLDNQLDFINNCGPFMDGN